MDTSDKKFVLPFHSFCHFTISSFVEDLLCSLRDASFDVLPGSHAKIKLRSSKYSFLLTETGQILDS